MDSEHANLVELLKSEEGRKSFTELFGKYFFSMRVRDGTTCPQEGYASRLKNTIKTSIIEDFRVNIFDFTLFPDMDQKWIAFIEDLGEEDLCFTEHRKVVPPQTLEKIYELLSDAKDAIEDLLIRQKQREQMYVERNRKLM